MSCIPLIPINSINTFMALGDSISAGLAILGKLEENRGLSFPIGQDPNALTLPNLFKKYTGNTLYGGSTGNHFIEYVNWSYYEEDGLNAAQSGAIIQDITFQIDYLTNKTIPLDKKWSHINLFIGANNLCKSCKNNTQDSAESFQMELINIIDKIFSSFQNVIVSMLSLPNFTNLKKLEDSFGCKILHLFVTECFCIFHGTDKDIEYVSNLTREYNKVIRDVYFSKKPTYPTLLLHPFNEETDVPSEEYVSTFDCFHPSLIAHENFAIATWNSLFLPFPKKFTKWNFDSSIYVPSLDDYIRLT